MSKRLAWFIIIVGGFAMIGATLHYANAQGQPTSPGAQLPPTSDPVTAAVASQLGELSIRNIQCGAQQVSLNSAYLSLRKEFEDYKASHKDTPVK